MMFMIVLYALLVSSLLHCIISNKTRVASKCLVCRYFWRQTYKKLSYRWQTARRICANSVAWLTSWKRPSLLTCVTMTNLVVLRWRVYAYIQENLKNWGALELHSLEMGGVADPKVHALPPHVNTPNLVVLRQRVCAYMEGNPKIGLRLGPAPLQWRHREIHPSPTCVILPNLVVPSQTVGALLRRSVWKKWRIASHLSRSLKVVETDTDRAATYDFLLKFHSNHAWAYIAPFPR